MKENRLNSTLSLIANIGVLIGLAVLILELGQNNDHLRLQLLDQINSRQITNNTLFLSPNPAPVIEKSLLEPESLSYTEFLVMDSYLINALNGWEDRFFLHEAGLVDDADWKTKIDEEADWYLGSKFGKNWWRTVARDVFEPEFAAHVDARVAELGEEESSYEYWLELQRVLTEVQ
ncbi:MAG: hypothetical protein P8X82_18410 [Gemmatimonadales bacterium]